MSATPQDMLYRFGEAGDHEAVRRLLAHAGLPADDLDGQLHDFILARRQDVLAGVVGLETLGTVGLLRSLVVAAQFRGRGIADALCHRALAQAQRRGLTGVYLLTTTAAGFFERWGFRPVQREQAPPALQAHAQFRSSCPASAVCMRKDLAGLVRYFPRELLARQPDVPGASFWAAALDRVSLTYFEVAPHTRFERHTHEGEQITLVLEGELCFEVDDRPTIRAGAGEVVALPAGTPHAVYATDRPVRAVDAWSPVPGRFGAGAGRR